MKVILNSKGYSYDVHSLVKAFYPEEDVKIETCLEDERHDDLISVYVSSGDIGKESTVSGCVRVSVPSEEGVISQEKEYCDLDRAGVKNVLKRVLYEVLEKKTKRSLPWGTMTGIRPVKVAMKMLRDNEPDREIKKYMKSVYLCSDDKIGLAVSIAHREAKILEQIPDDSFSLYVGIPFCPTTCMYCSFTSYPIVSWKQRTKEYIATLKREIDFFSGYYRNRKCDSIYIGGGTPTTLEADELRDLLGYIRSSFDLSDLREFTVEAGRPDSITDEKLLALKECDVSRISVNPQTMNEKTLKLIGRRHTVEDVYSAFEKARGAGFSNINTDLILGLPGEDEEDVKYTFDRIRELAPDSVTVHSMAIKRAASMHRFLDDNPGIVSTNTPRMMDIAAGCCDSLGLVPYYLYRQKNMAGNFENVGYAREGMFGIYNILIMEEVTDIAAAGAGTISKRVFDNGRIERCDNVKDVALYIDRIDEMIDKKRKLFEQ